jgi:hypothetical protein
MDIVETNSATELILREFTENKAESSSVFDPVYKIFYNDFQYYLSDQWREADKAVLDEANVPALSLNMTKKIVDTVTGYERQNRTDIKALPIEGADETNADIYTQLSKWTMSRRNQEYTFSDAFKDTSICGLGWVHAYIDFQDDLISGDIKLKKIPYDQIKFDPRATEKDLSDCQYIIHSKVVHKTKVKKLYPQYTKQIDQMKGYVNANGATSNVIVPEDNGNYIIMSEHWKRDYVKKTLIIDPEDPKNLRLADAVEGDTEGYQTMTRTVPCIKLSIILNEDLVVWDGENPNKTADFPFIPIWGYFDSSFDDWTWKVQGMVRSIKDIQNEKNKFRSQIAHAVNTQVHSGFIFEKGAVDDKNVLRNTSGSGKLIEVNKGKRFEKIPPPDVPTALMQLQNMFTEDFYQMSLNPDLLGSIGDKGSAGVTVQIRQKQGLAALQEIFDNVSLAKKGLGRLIIQMIIEFYDHDKIKRILGSDMSIFFQPEEKRKIKTIVAKLKAEMLNLTVQGHALTAEAQLHAGAIPENEDDVANLEDKVQNIQIRAQTIDKNLQEMKDQLTSYDAYVKQRELDEANFWESFDMYKKSSYYDITVDESVNSPTYRLSNQMMFTQLAQSGVQYSPRIYLELADIPKGMKDKLLAEQDKMEQAQQQAAQQQQDTENALQVERIKTERMKAMAGSGGKMDAEGNPTEEQMQ